MARQGNEGSCSEVQTFSELTAALSNGENLIHDSPIDNREAPSNPSTNPQTEPNSNPYQSPSIAEDNPSVPSPTSHAHLRLTKTGLLSVYYGICVILASTAGVAISGILITAGGSYVASSISFLLVPVAILAGLGGVVANFVGQCMCITVPKESGGRGYIQLSIFFQISLIALNILNALLAPVSASLGMQYPSYSIALIGSSLLGILSPVGFLAAFVSFLLFLKKLALYISRVDLSKRSSGVIARVCIITAIMIAAVIFFASERMFNSISVALFIPWSLLAIVAVTSITTFIKYANLVKAIAGAIRLHD